MTKSRNDRIVTYSTNLSSSTCCRIAKHVVACRTKCAPASAALIPSTLCNGVMVSTIGRKSKIFSLIPLVAPTIRGGAGIHSTENNIRVSCRKSSLIHTVLIGIGHIDPLFACGSTPGVNCKTGIIGFPVIIRSQVNRNISACSTCEDCCHAHQKCHQHKKSN